MLQKLLHNGAGVLIMVLSQELQHLELGVLYATPYFPLPLVKCSYLGR